MIQRLLKERLDLFLSKIIKTHPLEVRIFKMFLIEQGCLYYFIINLKPGKVYDNTAHPINLVRLAFDWGSVREPWDFWRNISDKWDNEYYKIDRSFLK